MSLKPLHLMLKRSAMLDRLMTSLHLIALLCAWLAGIAWIWKLALTAAIGVDYWHWRTLGGGRSRTEKLMFSRLSGWTLEQQGREPETLRILPCSVVSPWLIILHGRVGNRPRVWVIPRDSLDAETFRCLRVYLQVLPLTARNATPAPGPGGFP